MKFPTQDIGGHSQLYSALQSEVNASTPAELGQKNLELNSLCLVFLSSANRSNVEKPNSFCTN